MSDRFEFGRPVDRLEAQIDGTVLPTRRTVVRRERPDGTFEEIGWVTLRLVQVLLPPVGHAPVAVRMEVPLGLAALTPTPAWDGVERRHQGP